MNALLFVGGIATVAAGIPAGAACHAQRTGQFPARPRPSPPLKLQSQSDGLFDLAAAQAFSGGTCVVLIHYFGTAEPTLSQSFPNSFVLSTSRASGHGFAFYGKSL